MGGRPILSAQSERETAQSFNLPLYLGLFMALFIGRGRYKYVHFSASHLQPMLFAIDDDPEEAKNLATDPAYQTVLVRFTSLRKVSAVLTEIEPLLSYSIAKRGDQFGNFQSDL